MSPPNAVSRLRPAALALRRIRDLGFGLFLCEELQVAFSDTLHILTYYSNMGPKDKKLKAALNRHLGVDHKLERQKKQVKAAEKRKKTKQPTTENDEDLEIETFSDDGAADEQLRGQIAAQLAKEGLAADAAEALDEDAGEGAGWETDESGDAEAGGVDANMLEDESGSDEEDDLIQNGGVETDGEGEEEIPLSDIESLGSEDRGDVIPHQRLTINNTAALQRSLKSFALPSTLPFSATQCIVSAEPVDIPDIEDDLNRELAFYKQSLDAVKEARMRLKKEGAPFSRPADYFAEMVKSEEQMGKVRQKMVDEAARKKASSDARRQRDLKKFGKAVQVAKLQERDKAKRETLDKINVLKRSTSDHPFFVWRILLMMFHRTTRRRPHRERGRHVRRCARRRRNHRQSRPCGKESGRCSWCIGAEAAEEGREVWLWWQEEVCEE